VPEGGIEVEIKAVTPSVIFSSDEANPDTAPHFYADLQMYTWYGLVDPGLTMKQFLSSEVASKQNKWQGLNVTRWQSPEYDRLFAQSEIEMDPVKRAAMLIALNDMVIKNVVMIPVVTRPVVTALANNLHAPLSGWDTNTFAIEDWYRDT
jgi:peptide/nickel transport system substrate-binding protein